jgi:serine/threonine protein kinase
LTLRWFSLTVSVALQALSRFRHPNIAALFAYTDPLSEGCAGGYYLLYELAEKGSLDTFLKDELGRSRLGSFQRRVQIAIDVLTAIQFLHEGSKDKVIESCFHRDIKSANIVIKRDFTAQVIDCGLAKLVNNDAHSPTSTIVGIKGTLGYIDPEYVRMGEYTARCDIYSFGVVLLELWTGRLQNYLDESGRRFSFGQKYIWEGRDVAADIDAFMDLDLPLPEFATRYTNLALRCVKEGGNDRPSGHDAFRELREILEECSTLRDDTRGSYEAGSNEPCATCRTMPAIPSHEQCVVCVFRKEIRELFASSVSINMATIEGLSRQMQTLGVNLTNQIWTSATGTNQLVQSVSTKMDSALSVLACLDLRLNNQVPRTFILVPADIKNGWKCPRSWLCSHVQTKFYLYFVCAVSQRTVSPPIKIKIAKDWVATVAPVLAAGLYLLEMSMKAGVNLCLGLDGASVELFGISTTHIAEMISVLVEMMKLTCHDGLLARLKSRNLSPMDVKVLNGDAYELVVEKALEIGNQGWRSQMKPVREPPSSQVFWVTNAVAADPKHRLEIVAL